MSTDPKVTELRESDGNCEYLGYLYLSTADVLQTVFYCRPTLVCDLQQFPDYTLATESEADDAQYFLLVPLTFWILWNVSLVGVAAVFTAFGEVRCLSVLECHLLICAVVFSY